MFCKICNNFMDITNNVSIPNTNAIENILNIAPGVKNDEMSSDYDVSSDVVSSRKKKTTIVVEEDIINILNGKDLSFELDNFNMNDLNKISYFNKLDSNQKTLVINRLYEKIPKNQKIPKNTDAIVTKDSYFYCKKCGYNEKIPEKMFIFSRTSEKSNEDTFSSRFINFKYDNTLPTTKKYNCINKACATHKEPKLKNAVFHRLGSTYAVRYICNVCDFYWNTSAEN
jgi:hypothetical protein